MSDSTKHAILHYLDEPVRFLYWTKGEIGFYGGVPFMGMLLEQELTSVFVMIFGFILHRQFKKRFKNINLPVLWYWYLPRNKKNKCLAYSYIRYYVG